MGRATLLGYKTAGILPVAKHYPGHGAAHGDSHQILPSSSLNKAHMYSSHLRPYIKPIAQNTLNAVMAAHVSFPKLDSSGLPATFSRVILTDQLRHDLGFNGLIMTDDVEMQAAKRFKTAESRTLQSINAGADIVMIAWNMKSQYQAKAALVSALKSGQLSKERVNESLIRISAAKENITVNDKPTRAEIRSLVYHRELYRAIEGIQVGRGPAGKQNASKIRQ
jgi:beta-N-acetylhexosaminidase